MVYVLLPHWFSSSQYPGVLLETFLGSIVEIVLLLVLLIRSDGDQFIQVVKDAILGSILANMLLCLGTCFFDGCLREITTQFDGAITEVGSGLLLVAGFGLTIPCAFFFGEFVKLFRLDYAYMSKALPGASVDANGIATHPETEHQLLMISRATAIILLIAYVIYVWFQMRTHHGLFDGVLADDEEKDKDRHRDMAKDKLTLTECFLALVIALALVSVHAVFLGMTL